MSDTLPVFVNVRRADGSVEQVRVGSAFRSGDGFTLQLGEMTIGSQPVAPAPAPRAVASAAPAYGSAPRSSGGGPTNFPNYGRGKNGPIAGASSEDLGYYANGARRSLADPSKARWHDKERELLAVIEAEMQRQGLPTGGEGGGGARPRPSFMQNEPGPGTRAGGNDEPPPVSDDDIPF